MAAGIFAVLDDIAVLADDVAVTTKVAATKTAGILGDDLAVNAQKATGFEQHRELKVIWAITKGSLKNKAIILPMAFLLSAFASWLIPYILILGGFYLLYEGAEKIQEWLFHKEEDKDQKEELLETTSDTILDVEKKKIKAAVFTDFILSIEIVMIALGTVISEPLTIQIVATTSVAILATFGVYGLVAMIVRIDNVGFWLIGKEYIKSGNFLILLMPKIINILSVVGTIAMILVGGGILSHNIDTIHHMFIPSLPSMVNEFSVGVIFGIMILIIINIYNKIKKS